MTAPISPDKILPGSSQVDDRASNKADKSSRSGQASHPPPAPNPAETDDKVDVSQVGQLYQQIEARPPGSGITIDSAEEAGEAAARLATLFGEDAAGALKAQTGSLPEQIDKLLSTAPA